MPEGELEHKAKFTEGNIILKKGDNKYYSVMGVLHVEKQYSLVEVMRETTGSWEEAPLNNGYIFLDIVEVDTNYLLAEGDFSGLN